MYKNEWSVHSNEIKWKGAIKEASLQSFTVLAFTPETLKWLTKPDRSAEPLQKRVGTSHDIKRNSSDPLEIRKN